MLMTDDIVLQRRALNQIMRGNFEAFLQGAFYEMHGSEIKWNWHHDVICDALFGCHMGEEKRLIINVPPRSLKSFICNIAWPAWLMGQNPRIKIISISYAQDLAGKFSRDQRQLMSSDFYKQIFPKTQINPKKCGETEFVTTAGGFRLATSTGGILTGRGADVIIIDDPIKPDDAYSQTQRGNCIRWIEGTLMTRLDDKDIGVMVMIMQRLHEEDPTGHFLEKGGWKHLSFPSIADGDEKWQLRNRKIFSRREGEILHPEHETESILNALKRDMGSLFFNSQYQQNPIPADGNIIKKEWFQYYEDTKKIPEFCLPGCILSIDTAMKDGDQNDWSVITVWVKRSRNYYLIDVIRKRMNFPELYKTISELARELRPSNILIEDKGSGTALIQQLRKTIWCQEINPVGDKVERLASASIAFEQGRVFFPANNPSWLKPFKDELLAFPRAKYDDQVDSTSQYLNYMITTGGNYGSTAKLTGI